MTKDAILTEIMSWPPHQRAALAQELWDSVADDGPRPLTDVQKAELDRRLGHDLAHPDRGVTLDELSERLRAKHGVHLDHHA